MAKTGAIMRRKGGWAQMARVHSERGRGAPRPFWAAGDAILRHMWLKKPKTLACHVFGVDMFGESVKKI